MEKTLQVLNRLKAERVVSDYAIGGGIAVLFYMEPFATFDLDVFILLPEEAGLLVSLAPLYTWLGEHGYEPRQEQVLIEGVPVQFIPAYNDLIRDGVRKAVVKHYGEVQTFVMSPEYLIVIMLQTGRPKDQARLVQFLDEADFSEERLSVILKKHRLYDTYEAFKKRFITEK